MSDFGDWRDPFDEGDMAARERAQRRAERAARRRATQASLAERVSGTDEAEADEATRPEAAADGGPPLPPEAGTADRAAQSGPTAGGAPPRRSTAGEAASAPAPASRPHAARAGGISPRELLVRRLIGLGVVAALIVILIVGATRVLDALNDDSKNGAPPKPLKVEELTIPEGLDHRQIADLAKDAGLTGGYEKAVRRAPKGFPIDEYAPDGDPPHLEGFLFPATYELEKNTTVKELVARQLEAFEQNLERVDLSYAESKNLTVYDVLKIASMVEREIQVEKERRLAAAVIYNRLAASDTLGIDATIRYEDQNYDEQLESSRLEEDTPYNTRVNPGLPPTPIGNPGLASIKAAANPASSDAYYFVVKPGTCGEHVFVETEEEFAQAEAEYQQALEAEGGSPTEC